MILVDNSLVQADFSQQLDEARVGTQRIVDLVHFEESQPGLASIVCSLQSVQAPLPVDETDIDNGGPERRDKPSRGLPPKLLDHRHGSGAAAGGCVGVPEKAGLVAGGSERVGLLQFRN